MSTGYVTQIIGPVIDIRFAENEVPAINEAVRIQNGQERVVVEVMQQRGEGMVRCVSFSPLLHDFHHDALLTILNADSLIDSRYFVLCKAYIDHGTDNLCDISC